MINYGINNSNSTASPSICEDGPTSTKKNKSRSNSRLSRFGMSGRRDLPGDGFQGAENLQMQDSDSMDKHSRIGEHQHQLLESGNGPQIPQTAFWLDVVPGV